MTYDNRRIRAVEQAVRAAAPEGLTEAEILGKAPCPTLASLKDAIKGAVDAKLIVTCDLPDGTRLYTLPDSVEAQ